MKGGGVVVQVGADGKVQWRHNPVSDPYTYKWFSGMPRPKWVRTKMALLDTMEDGVRVDGLGRRAFVYYTGATMYYVER